MNDKKKTTIYAVCAAVAVIAVIALVFLLAKGDMAKPGSSASPELTVNGDVSNPAVQDAQLDDGTGKSANNGGGKTSTAVSTPSIGDTNVNNVQADNGGVGGKAAKPWKVLTDKDYQISMRVLNAWSGPFWEDGTDEDVSNVLALQFRNDGEKDIQYAEYVFDVNGEDIIFKLSDIPVGQTCVVLEARRHAYNANEVLALRSRLVAAVEQLPSSDKILLVNNSDNSFTVMNLTDTPIERATVRYKYYYAEQETFIGGITYSADIENIPAGGSVTVTSDHYESDASFFTSFTVFEG